jgi:hypothetical protein
MEDSHFVCIRRIVNIRSVLKRYNKKIKNIDSKLKMAVDNPNYFSNYDYARVKHSIFWSEDVID